MKDLSLHAYPGMNRFVLDWLSEEPRATRFLPRTTATIGSAHSFEGPAGLRAGGPAGLRRRHVATELLDALEASNRLWGSFVSEELRQWAEGNTVTLFAGQQTGFAGGPLYTLAKVASLIRMRRDLEARRKRATIFFWLATEDHDYAEAATLQIPVRSLPQPSAAVNRQVDLVTLRATRGIESKAVVGPSPIPESLIVQFLSLHGIERPSWLREGVTFRDSFAELCASVFDEKIVYVDALLPELRRAGAPLFERLLAERQEIQHEIARRSAEIEDAGFTPQVSARPGESYTLLFRIDGRGERIILGEHEVPGDPATISTSAITRPLLQDYVFAPDVFVGGPAEVAYYAQIEPLHRMLGIELPRVALRGHVLVAPKRTVRSLERHGLGIADVFSTADDILAARETSGVAEIEAIASEARSELARQITRIGELALPAEHALSRAVSRSIGHIEYHFDRLTERAVRALVRKDRERHEAVRELVGTFYPDRHVQDRVVGWIAWWLRYGRHLVDRVTEEIVPDSDTCRVVEL